jgi:hypothetical protein
MSFFDDVPPRPPPQRRRIEYRPWAEPPPGWAGGWVSWRFVLLRSPDCYCVVSDFEAFETGVEFSVAARVRPGADLGARRPGPPISRGVGAGEGALLGIGLADGTKAVLGRPFNLHEEPPPGPLLLARGGGGNREDWQSRIWFWPLPPPGPMRFVMSWPKLNLGDSEVTADANVLIEAAAKAERLWDVDEEP